MVDILERERERARERYVCECVCACVQEKGGAVPCPFHYYLSIFWSKSAPTHFGGL
jgi:hypothetical protein